MTRHTPISDLAQRICDVVAEAGHGHPWVVRLHATRSLVDLFLRVESSIVPVRGAIYTRSARERLRGDLVVPRSRFELEELKDQFGPSFADIGFQSSHALITTADFSIEVANAGDLIDANLLPVSARVIAGGWTGHGDLIASLPLGCVAVYRIEHGPQPKLSREELLGARWLEIRAAARLRWILDAPARHDRTA